MKISKSVKDKLDGTQIYQKLFEVITENKLSPNYRLQEQKLALTFNVSRTVIREALQRLSLEKIIKLEKNKGASVYCPTTKESKEIFYARKLLECSSLEESFKKINTGHINKLSAICENEKASLKNGKNKDSIKYSVEFHLLLVSIAGNDVITNIVRDLAGRTSLIISSYGSPYGSGCSCGNHHEMLNKIRNNDITGARLWLVKHFNAIENDLNLDQSNAFKSEYEKIFLD